MKIFLALSLASFMFYSANSSAQQGPVVAQAANVTPAPNIQESMTQDASANNSQEVRRKNRADKKAMKKTAKMKKHHGKKHGKNKKNH